jgi:hypothetical protein
LRAAVLCLLAGCFNPDPERNARACVDWCPPPEQCIDSVCRVPGEPIPDASPDAFVEPNKMFVLHDEIQINMRNAQGLDQHCQLMANGSSLGGTYKAFIASSGMNAIDRLAPANGWVRVDGKPFVNSRSDLAAGKIFYPQSVTERNMDIRTMDTSVATGALPDGSVSPNGNCSDWILGAISNTRIGKLDATAESWTSSGNLTCGGTLMRLYCFGVDRSARVGPPGRMPTHKRAFVTEMTYSMSDIATADAACRLEGGGADFLAMLATTSTNILSRFNSTGPWARMDGVVVSQDMTGFLAPLNVTFKGEYVTGGVWVGSNSLTQPGGPNFNCESWTNPTGLASVGDSTRSFTSAPFSGLSNPSCNTQKFRFYCAEP